MILYNVSYVNQRTRQSAQSRVRKNAKRKRRWMNSWRMEEWRDDIFFFFIFSFFVFFIHFFSFELSLFHSFFLKVLSDFVNYSAERLP